MIVILFYPIIVFKMLYSLLLLKTIIKKAICIVSNVSACKAATAIDNLPYLSEIKACIVVLKDSKKLRSTNIFFTDTF